MNEHDVEMYRRFIKERDDKIRSQQEIINQCRLAFAGMVSVSSAVDMIDAAGE